MNLAFFGESSDPPSKLSSRHPWAYLLQRVFAVDVMKLLKIADEPDDIARALAEVGLGPRPPPLSRASSSSTSLHEDATVQAVMVSPCCRVAPRVGATTARPRLNGGIRSGRLGSLLARPA
jgi:hypothetical protein